MSSSPSSGKPRRSPPQIPRPSSSVVVVSPDNQVLLLHRVKTSTSFASAHVFPGGNLDAFHDGDIPPPGSPLRHEDGRAYRLGAVRECFEETGILLARTGDKDGDLVHLGTAAERDEARTRIHGNAVRFMDFVGSTGGVPDIDNLIPFTRWITPANVPKRFTTQMYIYLLPLDTTLPSEMLVPTPDGGVEHTAATFAHASTFLDRAAGGEIILFPPQVYLLHHVARFLPAPGDGDGDGSADHRASQRERLVNFLRAVPTTSSAAAHGHPTSRIAWADKVISPHTLFLRKADGRVVLGLDKPGPELATTSRGGDHESVALVRFAEGGLSDVEIRLRAHVLAEEKSYKDKL
ncbi:NUDIX domain [Geosmithia morbida]|uniref:NUDIX domain n=1 Tax=Geosmithia morbida TaxID=1094350 RepID=A0A9P4Z059_9HYPO|nr:NUDIX domain [Geosmithia morbida]KAF4124987.1 NUDIX domain [Geosmithia morbida]